MTKPTKEDIFSLLFNPGEIVGFKIKPQFKPQPYSESCLFFALNPLLNYGGGASNENVAAHRNFLFEMDGPTLVTQVKQLETKRQLPFATKVFSGNKSWHYIVALEEDVGPQKYAEYWQLLKYILRDTEVDMTASNPSRLTRCPGGLRGGDVVQRIGSVGRRISVVEWERWLLQHPTNYAKSFVYYSSAKERIEGARAARDAGRVEGAEPAWVVELLDGGIGRIGEGVRHKTIVAAAVSGASLELLVDLSLALGKDEEEAVRCYEWAERRLVGSKSGPRYRQET